MSDVKILFMSPNCFIFVDSNIPISLGLILLPVSSFSQQAYHCSGISNVLGSPGFNFIASQKSFSKSPFRDTPDAAWPQWFSLVTQKIP